MDIFNPFRKPTKKDLNKEKMQRIRELGRSNESFHDIMNPNDEKTYHGADRVNSYRDKAGRIRKQPIELKYNNSKVSKLQKKRAQFIKRTYPDGTTEIKHRDGSPAYRDFDGRYRKEKSDSYFNMFGLGSTSNKKKKSNSLNDMFRF